MTELQFVYLSPIYRQGFLGISAINNPPVSAGDMGLIPGSGSGRSPGEGNDNPPQCLCLENSMDGGVWQAPVHEVTKSQMQPSD